MTVSGQSRGWSRENAYITSRAPAYVCKLLGLPSSVEVVKFAQDPYGQLYQLTYIDSKAMRSEVIVAVRTGKLYTDEKGEVSLHLNRDQLRLIETKRAQNIPVIVVASIPESQTGGDSILMAIPYSRLESSVHRYLASGGSRRIPLNVVLTRRHNRWTATLIRRGHPHDVSDCIGLHELTRWLPEGIPPDVDERRKQFTAQYEVYSLLSTVARTTMDVNDMGPSKRWYRHITDRLQLTPMAHVNSANSSGLKRADVVAIKNAVLRESGFTEVGPHARLVIVEVEAKGGKASIGRKFGDRVKDALDLGAPPESIYLYAIVPAQQRASVEIALRQLFADFTYKRAPVDIGGIRVWSMVEVELAYRALTGQWSTNGGQIATQFVGPLI